MVTLNRGDVLSYSAGSTQTGPMGYRKLHGRGNLLAEAGRRWPELLDALGERPILFINAYPATLGTFSDGITVDTYLSPRVTSRALQLGRLANHPVILAGQPLFLAHALLEHIAAGRPMPEVLMIWVGGYVLHYSLEQMLKSLLAPHVSHLLFVQYYGAAEVDAGCMMGRERNEQQELIYYPRHDVVPELDGDQLLLTLHRKEQTIIERFPTGDQAQPCGNGWLISNPERLHPLVNQALQSWSESNWKRRTGYVRRDKETLWIQLRKGETPRDPAELEHFEFARRFGFSWLDKPCWK